MTLPSENGASPWAFERTARHLFQPLLYQCATGVLSEGQIAAPLRHRVNGRKPGGGFRYHDLGSAAYISRGQAVISVGPLKLDGFAGWVSWLFIHIAFLTGYRNRVGALMTWWLAFTRDRRRERAFTTATVGRAEDVYCATS